MKKYKLKILAVVFSMALGLTGCDSKADVSSATNGDLASLGDIHMYVRENGSGTRDVFEEYLDLSMSEEGKDKYEDISNAAVKDSADEMLAAVAADAAGVGYASAGQLEADVKAVAVDGIECSAANISKGSYPLSRSFYLAWNKDNNELIKEFVRYVSSAGQDIVSQDYVTVAKAGTFLCDKALEGVLTVTGSSSVAPLVQELADAYMKLNPKLKITVSVSDSTTGISDMLQGRYDIAMSSRELKSYESKLVEYTEIAKDGIAVVVPKDSPVNVLTKTELGQIFSGKITGWADLNQ